MRSLAAASLLALVPNLGKASGPCPTPLRDPYMDEASPFGWPVSPADWDFAHPNCWENQYVLCSGSQQSPMDIDFRSTDASCRATGDGSAGALADHASYNVVSGNVDVKVSKYMRTVMASGSFGTLILKDSEGNNVEYSADQVHLTAKSMHPVNGTHMAAELLIIHTPTSSAHSGNVVVSVLFSEGQSSPLFDQMGLNDARSAGESMWSAPASIDLGAATSAALQGNSYTYHGSVPVPPCNENVQYIVFAAPQQATRSQIEKLEEVLTTHTGGTHKRPAIERVHSGSTCRTITLNDDHVHGHSGESACSAAGAAERSASCWTSSCGASPINIVTAQANTELGAMPATDIMHYSPAEHITVEPSMYTLDATVHHGDFGYIMVGGRKFEAKKISFKPISAHTINGRHYAGEIMIEHELYGDSLGSHSTGHTDAHRRLESESQSGNHSAGHGSSHASSTHRVMVSVPVALGAESLLLRSLGLGLDSHSAAIRDGHSYSIHGPVDLTASLAPVAGSEWYWYSGSALAGGECSGWGTKWMVFATPLQVGIEQLNSLHMQVSGVDSSPPVQTISSSLVYKSSMPAHAAEAGSAGSCGSDAAWSYEEPSCWGSAASICTTGTLQSPINIETSAVQSTGTHSFLSKLSWKPIAGLRAESNGHGLQVYNEHMGYMTLIGESGFPDFYQVSEFDIHMPSEHMIDGRQFPAELQVVMKKQIAVGELDDNSLVIASVMFEIGAQNSTLLKQLHLPGHLPTPNGHQPITHPVDIQWALGPALDGDFYHYLGSLTTPSCAETVKWAIFEKPLTMSQEQLTAFKTAYHTNNRPVQPLNGRMLVKNSMQESEAIDYRYFLGRQSGHDRRTPTIGLILVPIIGTILLMTIVMGAMWVREETTRRKKSAGGLETVIGRSTYDRM